jgi:hypothetical protein
MSRFMFPWLTLIRTAGLLLCVGVQVLMAQDESAKPAPALPTDKSLWLNSSPFQWEHFRGKGVCLFFFECNTEGTEVLPKYVTAAKGHATDPVVFLGVAMGSDRLNTEKYLKGTQVNWPILCDLTYAFSRSCDACIGSEPGDGLIDSVCGCVYVTPDGKMSEGFWEDPESTVEMVLEGAAWVTDPKDVPEPLLPVWRCVEFRKYSEALPLFKKVLNSGPETQRAAARKLQDVVQGEMDRLAAEAKTADEADQKWIAYSALTKLQEDFRGYDVPKDLDALQKKLARTAQVKAGIVAEKQLPSLAQSLTSPNPPIRKKAQSQLEKIVADFPDSELAQKAQDHLDSIKASK